MYIRFEKFSHHDGQHRYLLLSLTPTLFAEWCVAQVTGPLGHPGGQERRHYCASQTEAQLLFERMRDQHMRRGFVPLPVQMGLL